MALEKLKKAYRRKPVDMLEFMVTLRELRETKPTTFFFMCAHICDMIEDAHGEMLECENWEESQKLTDRFSYPWSRPDVAAVIGPQAALGDDQDHTHFTIVKFSGHEAVAAELYISLPVSNTLIKDVLLYTTLVPTTPDVRTWRGGYVETITTEFLLDSMYDQAGLDHYKALQAIDPDYRLSDVKTWEAIHEAVCGAVEMKALPEGLL